MVTDLAGASATAQVLVDVLALPEIGGVEAQIGPGNFLIDVSGLPENQWPSAQDSFRNNLVETHKNYRLRFEILP